MQVPCVVKEGNLHGADVHVCVCLGYNGHLSVFANILGVPHNNHLWKVENREGKGREREEFLHQSTCCLTNMKQIITKTAGFKNKETIL